MAYDVRPLVSLKEKREILPQAAAENWILFFEHDRSVECATVRSRPSVGSSERDDDAGGGCGPIAIDSNATVFVSIRCWFTR